MKKHFKLILLIILLVISVVIILFFLNKKTSPTKEDVSNRYQKDLFYIDYNNNWSEDYVLRVSNTEKLLCYKDKSSYITYSGYKSLFDTYFDISNATSRDLMYSSMYDYYANQEDSSYTFINGSDCFYKLENNCYCAYYTVKDGDFYCRYYLIISPLNFMFSFMSVSPYDDASTDFYIQLNELLGSIKFL